jgi:PIN domain nuclease of toxin-antitoxin system
LAFLIDTQTLVWFGMNSDRLSPTVRQTLLSEHSILSISAVVAYEFADLSRRGRFGADLDLDEILTLLSANILDYPAPAWRIAAGLPDIHRDPVDRMLIAHALCADMTLVTADATMRRYPVKLL